MERCASTGCVVGTMAVPSESCVCRAVGQAGIAVRQWCREAAALVQPTESLCCAARQASTPGISEQCPPCCASQALMERGQKPRLTCWPIMSPAAVVCHLQEAEAVSGLAKGCGLAEDRGTDVPVLLLLVEGPCHLSRAASAQCHILTSCCRAAPSAPCLVCTQRTVQHHTSLT